MDDVWEEEQVTFMANQDPSSSCSSQMSAQTKAREEQATPVHWVTDAGSAKAQG